VPPLGGTIGRMGAAPDATALLRTFPACAALCDRLGIDLPVVQAPIVASPALTAAVAEAGGLGTLPGSWLDAPALRRSLREVAGRTQRPFAVNLVLQWQQHERLAVALDEGVRAVSLFWGDPAPYLPAIAQAGAVALVTVASADEARRAVEAGADVVVAQGWEAGGHVWGEVATLPLVPRVVDAVAPVPVLAAGGIADGRGLAAALCLGAGGVWMGTRFVASREAALHDDYKGRVLAAAETDTLHTRLFDEGWPDAPHRVLRNSTVRGWLAAGRPPSGQRPGEGEPVAATDGVPHRRYSDALPEPHTEGDVEALALYAGQSAGLVAAVEGAGELVRRIAGDAAALLDPAARSSAS
jgi:nitronate monooxygenase